MLKIEEINVYPVKSLKGYALDSTHVGVEGIAYDRHWVITDLAYRFVTQRQYPEMSQISTQITEDHLVLTRDTQELRVALHANTDSRVNVTVWQDNCYGFDEGDTCAKWLNNVLAGGEDTFRLVRYSDHRLRYIDSSYTRHSDSKVYTKFSDSLPFLFTSVESLDYLNTKLVENGFEKISMDRFRANVVLSGFAEPFAEHTVELLGNNDFSFSLCKPCKRCKVTTINPENAQITDPKEPLQTLMQINPRPHLKGAYFGENAILIKGLGQHLRVGETLSVKKPFSKAVP